jgi:serine phosphatase RsbU (regulator of sigma subunit)
MRAELEVARQIQNNLLRQSWPDLEGIRIQACCFPAREVGGDFFEVFVHPKGDIWLAVGDVSGKGVPAALFMASAISVMRRELSQENPPTPHAVMQNLNSSLSEDLIGNNCFITMVLARYTPSTGELVYANAGHIYPLVWSYKDVAKKIAGVQPNFLKARGVPLGILPVWRGTAGDLQLNPGEALLLASDGITEATVTQEDLIPGSGNGNDPSEGFMLKQEGLWTLLTQEASPLNLTHLLDRVRGQNQVQEDDQTILSLEVL